jgi:gliding motility-associated-like protein
MTKTTKKALFFLLKLLFFLGYTNQAVAQNAACDGSLYLIVYNDESSVLQRIRPASGKQSTQVENIPLSTPKRRITCLGFNVTDGYLYGLDFNTKELLRVDVQGQVLSLGTPRNINMSDEYWAGTIDALGRNLTVIGRNPITGADHAIFNININARNTPFYAGFSPLLSDGPVSLTDLAVDPILGVTYGFDGKNRQLVTLGGSGVSNYAFRAVPAKLSSLFFDKNGQLYGYGAIGEENGSILFKVNKSDGKVTPIYNGITAKDTDGCSCPYSLIFQKKVTPTKVLPCSEIEITYTIQNQIGTSWLGLDFIDQLPDGFIIKEIEYMTSKLRTIESGEGTNRLELSNFDILLEKNTIKLKVYVGSTVVGKFSSQAFLDGLPLLDGSHIPSDDVNTPAPDDPNIVEIVAPKDIPLLDKLRFSCNGDTAFIDSPVLADSYRWSDGSTKPSLMTTRNGLYSLHAFTPCAQYRDSINISQRPKVLSVDLGGARQVVAADSFQMGFNSNESGPFAVEWSVSPTINLSCVNCATPTITANQSGTVQVILTNAKGCKAIDTVSISVEPIREVYIANAFSPNGDGQNDVFFIQGRVGSKVLVFRIFDRWGGIIFEKQDVQINDPEQGWNPAAARHLPEGVYLYQTIVEFPDGVRKSFQGTVQLMR